MASTHERINEWIMKKVFEETPGELSSFNPKVLSCGGIYIPHPEARRNILQHILVTPNDKEPVKVMTGARPRDVLRDMLIKESLN